MLNNISSDQDIKDGYNELASLTQAFNQCILSYKKTTINFFPTQSSYSMRCTLDYQIKWIKFEKRNQLFTADRQKRTSYQDVVNKAGGRDACRSLF